MSRPTGVILCSLLVAARGRQLLDDAVGLVQSSHQWHSWNGVGLTEQDAEATGVPRQAELWPPRKATPSSRAAPAVSLARIRAFDAEAPKASLKQAQWHSFDNVGLAQQAAEGATVADQGAATIDDLIDQGATTTAPVLDETAVSVLSEKEVMEAQALGATWAARRTRVSTKSVSDAVAKIAMEAKSKAAAKVKAQGLEKLRSDTLATNNATMGRWAQQWRKQGYASWADWHANKKDRKQHLYDIGDLYSAKEDDEAASTVTSLSWPAHENLPKPALLTMLNRARLGNRLFQWSAMLAIAKEAGARVAAPFNGRYTPTSTPQFANLEELIWSGEDMDWLNEQPNKCHMWDQPSPLTLDLGIGKLQNWTLANVPKGETHIKAARQPRKGDNWARLWADAILDSPTPSTGSCDVVELDGFWQRAEFFVHHLDWLRPTFWNPETAGVAKETLDSWLSETGSVGAVVGIHLRLGDYIGMGRNLNMDYYRNGLLEVKRNRNVDALTCVIFSDDITLAREVAEEFEACTKRIPVYPCADLKQGTHCWASQRIVTDRVSFYMMGLLPNIIIADSTYSFWAALLAPNKPMVVTPRVVSPERFARRGDYAYLDAELYGWWGVNASLGNHTSVAVQKALDAKTKLDLEAPTRWLATGEKWKIMQEEEYLMQVRESEWGA